MRRGLALGCGGTLGFAWTAVALQALDWDVRTADVLLGTSAGAEMAALLGSGRSADDIVAALDGDSDDPVLSWLMRQHPGIRPPLPRFGWPAAGLTGRALRGEVVVVAPMTSAVPAPARGLSRLERVLRRRMTRGLDREVARLRAAGTRVVRIEPGPAELAAMGFNFMDVRRRQATLTAARTALGSTA